MHTIPLTRVYPEVATHWCIHHNSSSACLPFTYPPVSVQCINNTIDTQSSYHRFVVVHCSDISHPMLLILYRTRGQHLNCVLSRFKNKKNHFVFDVELFISESHQSSESQTLGPSPSVVNNSSQQWHDSTLVKFFLVFYLG